MFAPPKRPSDVNARNEGHPSCPPVRPPSPPPPKLLTVAERPGDALAVWVAASCARHGVPVKVTDAAVIARTVTLLSAGAIRPAAGRTRADRSGLQPPDRVGPVRVELTGTGDARVHDDVVEHRGHDGGLAGEVQAGPLSA